MIASSPADFQNVHMGWSSVPFLASATVILLLLALSVQDEERRRRNRMVDWWCTVTLTGETSSRKLAMFARDAAIRMLRLLDRVFGSGFGLQFAFGSFLCTHAGIVIAFAVVLLVHGSASVEEQRAFLFVATTMLLLFHGVLWQSRTSIAIYAALWALLFATIICANEAPLHIALQGPIAIAVGLMVDCGVLTMNRALLRRSINGPTNASLYALTLLLVVPVALAVTTLALGARLQWGYGLAFVLFATSINTAIGLFLFVVAAAVGLNAIVWPAIARILQNLHEGRGPTRKQLLSIAIALFLLGLAQSPLTWALEELHLGGGKSYLTPATTN